MDSLSWMHFDELRERVQGLEWLHVKNLLGRRVRFHTANIMQGVLEGEVYQVSRQGYMGVRLDNGHSYDVYPCQLED